MKKVLITLTVTLLSLTTLYAETPMPITTYTLTTTDNKTLNITETQEGLEFQEFKGKAVLLAFFGHRCPPCIREIPEFIKLTKKHQDDLEIVAIESQNSSVDNVIAFKKEHKMNYTVVAGVKYRDFITKIAGRAGYPEGIPLPLLIAIDKEGEVQDVQAGQLSEQELESLVKELNE